MKEYHHRLLQQRSAEADVALAALVKIFAKAKPRRILDLGCGEGRCSLAIKEAADAEELCGLDCSEPSLSIAQQRGIKALKIDLNEDPIPFEDASFDAILCKEVIDQLWSPDHLLKEIHRVLKPGGTVVLTCRNLSHWVSRLLLLFGFLPLSYAISSEHGYAGKFPGTKWVPETVVYIRLFTFRALLDLLNANQFHLIRIKAITQRHDHPLLKIIAPLEKIVITVFPSLGEYIIVEFTSQPSASLRALSLQG